MSAIGAALVDAETDADIRAVVITGTGSRAFCAGMDLGSFREGEDLLPTMREHRRAIRGNERDRRRRGSVLR
jgi:enoyl-CoA hydratase/carnithine racemase